MVHYSYAADWPYPEPSEQNLYSLYSYAVYWPHPEPSEHNLFSLVADADTQNLCQSINVLKCFC